MKVSNSEKKNINDVVTSGLCTGCGICYCACSFKAISISPIKGNFRPIIDQNKCKNCGICVRSCPGIGINLLKTSKDIFLNAKYETKLIGRYEQCYIGYSTDSVLRNKAASGGVLSQFLIWLVENHIIDGVLVTRFDNNSPFKVRSFVARNREEIISAKGSKYAPVSLHEGLSELKKLDSGNYVIVGLPCHIHGIRKLLSNDRKLKERIVGVFSLFCSGTQSFYYTEYILEQCGGKPERLEYLAYREGWPTGMVAKGDGFSFFRSYDSYNKPLKGTFYPRRCLFCIDMMGEVADISFGDIKVKNDIEYGSGISAIIVRSKEWKNKLERAKMSGEISLSDITVEQLLYKRPMANIKKSRNLSFIQLLHWLKLPVPDYGQEIDSKFSIQALSQYCIMRLKQIIGENKLLWFLLPQIKSMIR